MSCELCRYFTQITVALRIEKHDHFKQYTVKSTPIKQVVSCQPTHIFQSYLMYVFVLF